MSFCSFRSALKLGCGVFVFVVTWILLGQNSEETVNESAKKQFTVRTWNKIQFNEMSYVVFTFDEQTLDRSVFHEH